MQTLLTVAYDGTGYCGWQRQSNGMTVQEKLEEALSAALPASAVARGEVAENSQRFPFAVRAASRTDAGVHALGQRAAFRHEGLMIPPEKLPGVINAHLPGDIFVTAATAVPDGFNPRHAERKTYRYQICNAPFPNPLLSRYSAFVPQKLNLDAMQKAALLITGRHDFKAFCATGGTGSGADESTMREIFDCRLTRAAGEPEGALLVLTVTGNAFLYNMVRIVAGTVLYAGLRKIRPEDIPEIIAAGDRTRAGKTMPPEGLTLAEVRYAPIKMQTEAESGRRTPENDRRRTGAATASRRC